MVDLKNLGGTPTNEVRSDQRNDQRKPMRKRKGNVDPLQIPKDIVPPGMTYEWKRLSVTGKEDPFYIAALQENGWSPVPKDRHKDILPDTIYQGLMLMERPQELTDEARAEDRQAANDMVRSRERQLREAPAGTFEREVKLHRSGGGPIPD